MEQRKMDPNLVDIVVFCDWHMATKQNPAGTDCTANLAEARVFKCPYHFKDIKYGKAGLANAEDRLYIDRCSDFEPTKEVKNLIKTFVKKK